MPFRQCFVPNLVVIDPMVVEKKIFKFRQYIFCYFFRGMAPFSFSWQTWIPFDNNALCQVWLKLTQWLWRSRIFYFLNVLFLFHYLPLGKGMALYLNKLTWISFIQGCFVLSLVKIGQVVLEKKMKLRKVYRQTDGQTGRQTDYQTIRWQAIGNQTWAFSSDELKIPDVAQLCSGKGGKP